MNTVSKTTKKLRIGILGIYHESNTFLVTRTTYADFEQGHLLLGGDIVSEYRDAFHEVGGILEVLAQQDNLEVIPILYAETTPSGTITSKAATLLLQLLIEQLNAALPLDGLMVVPHGAAVSEDIPDFDGYWLTQVREILGPDIPIVGTIDPHCNLSQDMVDAVNALVAYKTNPHLDQREVGKEAAGLLLHALNKKGSLQMKAIHLPMAISIEMQHTGSNPCKALYDLSREIAERPGVLSVSIVLGFPYADVAEMGSSLLVVADGKGEYASEALEVLNQYMKANFREFSGHKIGLADLLPQLNAAEKPLLLLDMGDNVGGGSPGDSTFLLKFLLDNNVKRSFICLFDPEVVSSLAGVSPGTSLAVKIGGKTDQNHGDPVLVEGVLLRIVSGEFSETEPRHGGQMRYNMGTTAILETQEGTVVMVTSKRIVPFSLQQLIQSGIRPETFEVLVAKGVNAPLAAYMPVCKSMIRVNTAGVTCADMNSLPYVRRRKPMFPFEPPTFWFEGG